MAQWALSRMKQKRQLLFENGLIRGTVEDQLWCLCFVSNAWCTLGNEDFDIRKQASLKLPFGEPYADNLAYPKVT